MNKLDSLSAELESRISEIEEIEAHLSSAKNELETCKNKIYRELKKLGLSKEDFPRIGIMVGAGSHDVSVSGCSIQN